MKSVPGGMAAPNAYEQMRRVRIAHNEAFLARLDLGLDAVDAAPAGRQRTPTDADAAAGRHTMLLDVKDATGRRRMPRHPRHTISLTEARRLRRLLRIAQWKLRFYEARRGRRGVDLGGGLLCGRCTLKGKAACEDGDEESTTDESTEEST